MSAGFTLELRAVPPTLMLGLLATLDALHREIQVTAFDGPGPSPVGRETHDALVEDRMQVEEARNAILDQAVAGRDAGRDRVDITASYAAEDIAPFLSARVGVAAAHEAAVRGDLLASPLTPDEHHLWTWVGTEFEAQAAGRPPTSYAPLAERAG